MASLKDMRVRIAATKATQKITKAMQMVAASKLRRAQVAAEAARPYAERMTKVLGSIAAAGGLHRRTWPVRSVQFVDRAAGARKGECADEPGQGRQNPVRRPQGPRPAAPGLWQADHRDHRTARYQADRLRAGRDDRQKDRRLVRRRRIRRLHAVLLALPLGDRAGPDRAANHPAAVRAGQGR